MFSKSSSSKKAAQQEMVQVDRPDSTSPFWKARNKNTNDKTRTSSEKTGERDPNMVIGASYSHADMLLKMDSHGSSSFRPGTPPKSSKSSHKKTNSASKNMSSSPTRMGYTNPFTASNSEWIADDDDEEDDDDEYGYDVSDGDEFGLPTMRNTKRKGKSKRKAETILTDPIPALQPWDTKSGLDYLSNRRHSNSADIAIERPKASYLQPKKSEGKILRPQYKEILRDPANSMHLIHHPPVPSDASQKEVEAHSHRINRINKFKKILQATNIPITELKSAAWNGVPDELRPMTWMLLLGYLPTSSERRVATLERKRKEYLDGVKQAFERSGVGSDNTSSSGSGSGATPSKARGLDEAVWHQISIDVPRTNPHLELYSYEATQRSLERILYLWAIRHPASGYVQGINDLATPFFQTFLSAYISSLDIENGFDPAQLPRAVLDAVEADTFWCLSKLLDGILDWFIAGQPGILRAVTGLRGLVGRIDKGLVEHMENEGVGFMQFAFRWMNCLLMREVSVKCVVRMWDTYMAETQGFSSFHLYVCAAFLVKWSDQLSRMDFQEIMMFLQALPTKEWTEKDVELLLSEAFIWMSLFQGSQAHLRDGEGEREGLGGIP